MESKRFPRVNSLKATSPDDPGVERFSGRSDKADSQRTGAAKAGNSQPPLNLGGNESPAWQDYFFLAPNVRFTRTPDYDASPNNTRREQVAVEESESLTPPTHFKPARPRHRQ
jgi:S-DNA-T family DNA segregation ATPase FtsK/SpoIIIE